jgi:hypothetical protein
MAFRMNCRLVHPVPFTLCGVRNITGRRVFVGGARVILRTHHKPNFILVTLHASSQILSPALAGFFISGWLNGLRVRNETARL